MTRRAGSAGGRRRRRSGARPGLRALADRLGIIPEYVDQTRTRTRRTTDATRVALLAAMGHRADSERRARESLERLFVEDRETIVPPALVLREGELRRHPLVDVEATGGGVSWSLSIRDEQGTERSAAGTARAGVRAAIAYPADLPPGYYDVSVRITGRGAPYEARQLLVIAPTGCPPLREMVGDGGVFGLTTNLYTVRSDRNAGFGDLTDLRALAEWGGEIGAAFIGVNPLHALFNRGTAISPYSPVSRLFRNPLYLDVTALPELADSPEAQEMLESTRVRVTLAELRRAARIDHERIVATIEPIARAVFRSFVERHRSHRTERWLAMERFCEEQGRALVDFGTFMALDRHHGNIRPWSEWPAGHRDPRSPAVVEFRERHADEILFHQWLQFALDAQLAEVASGARDAGMRIGLYQDLAIGTAPQSADRWANPGLFVSGASLGAPPDPYSETGQVWGLPPIDPRRLARSGYRYWIEVVRASLRHAGALRIDHVMGLFQQFWIPDGATGEDGAYVGFPADDLLGILTLEATRARALVVGEDLGTVPPHVPPAMRECEILRSRVLYFERTRSGGFARGSTYPRFALATANTHDMPTLAGWWGARDLDLHHLLPKKRKRGAEGREGARERTARAAREKEKRALLRRLAAEGALPSAREPESGAELRGAVHRFLCSTPAALVGISLDDLAGEVEPVNLPGVEPDRFPSWTRRMGMSLEEMRRDGEVQRALGCERRS